jgi:hypothetical protein
MPSHPLHAASDQEETGTSMVDQKKEDPEENPYTFWIVSTAEIQVMDYAIERTTVKLFTKWWFKCPDFFNKEKLKGLVKFDDDKSTSSSDASYDSLLKGDMVFGCRIDGSSGSNYFPVNPKSLILNAVSQSPSAPDWVQLIVPKPDDKTTLRDTIVSCQLVITAELHTPFNMREYPFDRHIVPIALATRKWKGNGKKYGWELATTKPTWAPSHYPEDAYNITESVAWIDPHAEMRHLPPIVHRDLKTKKPVLCLRVQRDPSYFIFTITVPICAIVLLCLSSFFLEFNNAIDRLNAILIGTLALAAYKNSVEVDIIMSITSISFTIFFFELLNLLYKYKFICMIFEKYYII